VPRFLIKKAYLAFCVSVALAAVLGSLGVLVLHLFIVTPFIFDEAIFTFSFLMVYKILDLIYIASIPTIFKLLQWHIQQEKQTHQITKQKLDAELQLLKNQLQPHFLFNTLNSLYGMVLTQDKNAAQVVLRLSDMMSYMLYESDHQTIALKKEIEQLDNYIELQKIRHGKRMELAFEKSGAWEGRRIAPLLLLPFVENAFKHGVEKNDHQSWIRINIWTNATSLEFMIENSLPENQGMPSSSISVVGGIGLENVKKRLELLYPKRYELTVRRKETHFVRLKLML
jgi:sensor histidine kinase YesM